MYVNKFNLQCSFITSCYSLHCQHAKMAFQMYMYGCCYEHCFALTIYLSKCLFIKCWYLTLLSVLLITAALLLQWVFAMTKPYDIRLLMRLHDEFQNIMLNIVLRTLLPSLIARRWVGCQTQWWPRHKAIYFSWWMLLGPPGFNCWFSFAPAFQWCCSTPQRSPGVGRNMFLSSPHLCFIKYLSLIYLFPVMIHWWVKTPARGPNNCMFWAMIEAEGEVGYP